MINNFLNKLQDRYFILVCFFVTLAFYYFVRLDAILQLAINFGVAIIALSQKKDQPRLPAEIPTQTEQMNVASDVVNVSEKPSD